MGRQVQEISSFYKEVYFMSDINSLPPQLAADLAQNGYMLVEKNSTLDKNFTAIRELFSNDLLINDSSLLTATSGLGFIQARTAFGIAAFGALYTKPCKESLLCA